MALTAGDNAPSFALFNTNKEKVTLEDQRGKNVLLLFFPLAFTSVCTEELCSVRDNMANYNATNAVVYGISVDSPQTLARYKDEQHFNFDLLSDFNKEISAAYGSIYEVFSLGMRGVSKRAAFLIDKDGVIRYAEVLDNAGEVPDFVKINELLKQLN